MWKMDIYIKKMCPKTNWRVAHTSGSLCGLTLEEGLYCEHAPLFSRDRFELKLATPEGKQVVLYPDNDEPKHILNIKRGIISALLVPPETEEDKQVLLLVRSLKAGDSGLAKSSSHVRGHVFPWRAVEWLRGKPWIDMNTKDQSPPPHVPRSYQ